MAKIVLGVTGSVAAVKAPELLGALWAAGHKVRLVVTRPALYFFDPGALEPPGCDDDEGTGREHWWFRDEDEWPGDRYRRGDEVLHIELRRWADLLVVAPLDANTLARFALGLSDNCLTCVFRAWDFARPVVLAPAMNTLMWESPVTRRHLGQLLADRASERGSAPPLGGWTLDQAPALFARYAPEIILVPPQAKVLACGDFGTGAMGAVADIAEAVRAWSEKV